MKVWASKLSELYSELEEHDLRMHLLRDLDREILHRSSDTSEIITKTIESLLPRVKASSAYVLKDLGGTRGHVLYAALGRHLSETDRNALFQREHQLSDSNFARNERLKQENHPQLFALVPGQVEMLFAFDIWDNQLETSVRPPWGLLLLEPQKMVIDEDFTAAVLNQLSIALRDKEQHSKLQEFRDLHSQFFSAELDERSCLRILRQRVIDLLADHDDLLVQILFVHQPIDHGYQDAPSTDEFLRIRWANDPAEIGTIVPVESISGLLLETTEEYILADPQDTAYSDRYMAFSRFLTRTELVVAIKKSKSSRTIGMLNIESPLVSAFTETEISEIVALVQQVSPMLVAVRRRNQIATAAREISYDSIDRYLRNLSQLYSHKFASPLVALMVNAHTAREMLQASKYDEMDKIFESLEHDIDWLRRSLRHLWREVENVATIGPVDVMGVLRELEREEKERLKGYLRVSADVAAVPPVRASRLLKEHLRNLIVNSMASLDAKVKQSGGSFEPAIQINAWPVTIKQARLDQDKARDEIERLNQRIRIEVRDNGNGIKKENLEHVFEPGFSTKGTTGYGLSGISDYVREMGGDRTIDTVDGEFCKVTIELPIWNDDEHSAPELWPLEAGGSDAVE